ncbi:hypothetical protein LY78DRAFT_503271 [Colletotrichum sublineola]|nr:hypothetical protein LY78DRAFT_503271 [Colletotrichum sublineola]
MRELQRTDLTAPWCSSMTRQNKPSKGTEFLRRLERYKFHYRSRRLGSWNSLAQGHPCIPSPLCRSSPKPHKSLVFLRLTADYRLHA